MCVYLGLNKSMHEPHKEEDEESRNEAEHIAKILISYANLLLLLRCRSLLFLGCSENPGYVEWANEAVRMAELGMSTAENPTEADYKLLEDCKQVLRQVEEDFAERGGYEEEDVEEGADIAGETVGGEVEEERPREITRRVDSASDVV
ncbi:hypothetical protein LTR36_001184 [Oleoguttula mirabilis]|uniref:Uncharacterized protein n=1 Tax=Oleoguttula mirabilis TaxID=1507867 RepID=A0AAV9J2V2_9PEZI|nr:hypothetical protein LTR36_001184 [Oleoguttula mirabilis]